MNATQTNQEIYEWTLSNGCRVAKRLGTATVSNITETEYDDGEIETMGYATVNGQTFPVVKVSFRWLRSSC